MTTKPFRSYKNGSTLHASFEFIPQIALAHRGFLFVFLKPRHLGTPPPHSLRITQPISPGSSSRFPQPQETETRSKKPEIAHQKPEARIQNPEFRTPRPQAHRAGPFFTLPEHLEHFASHHCRTPTGFWIWGRRGVQGGVIMQLRGGWANFWMPPPPRTLSRSCISLN